LFFLEFGTDVEDTFLDAVAVFDFDFGFELLFTFLLEVVGFFVVFDDGWAAKLFVFVLEGTTFAGVEPSG